MTRLTIFSIPREFEDIHGVRQRNALGTWTRLEPRPEIILFGDDAGVKEAAEEFGCIYSPGVERNEWGTPTVDWVFYMAEFYATTDVLCYVNADILLFPDILEVAETCDRAFADGFLVTGQRWDAPLLKNVEIDFECEDWADWVWEKAQPGGGRHSRRGEDWFLFRRGRLRQIPPFAVGRSAWDNWLVFYFTSREMPTVDATSCVRAIHQGRGKVNHPRADPEYRHNQRLWKETGFPDAGYTTSTLWILRPGGKFELRQKRSAWRG